MKHVGRKNPRAERTTELRLPGEVGGEIVEGSDAVGLSLPPGTSYVLAVDMTAVDMRPLVRGGAGCSSVPASTAAEPPGSRRGAQGVDLDHEFVRHRSSSAAARDGQPGSFPFGVAVLESAGVEAASAELTHGVVGIDAERAAAVRDDLDVLGQ